MTTDDSSRSRSPRRIQRLHGDTPRAARAKQSNDTSPRSSRTSQSRNTPTSSRSRSAHTPDSSASSTTPVSRPRKSTSRLATKKFLPLSREQLEKRRESVPVISYPDLPVSSRREEIARAISEHQVIVVAGETGSGKTTQLPKICLELGRGINGMIGHTQPRRIAARAVAERISQELGVCVGSTVGYQVRFTEEVGEQTLVKLMTDGILLAEIQSDPELSRYDTIIIDEAHERSLNIDFLLGYLARLLPRRPDLKLIITSATIDTQRFADHFNAPVIEVSGRTYPVEIRYRPLYSENFPSEISSSSADFSSSDDSGALPSSSPRSGEAVDQVTGIVEACEELMLEGPGDILVFLSGEGEIKDAQEAFSEELKQRYIAPGGRSSVPGAVEVLPLFSRLSSAEQHRIFEPHSHRRIILATNIAETSLTVPGIRYVVDPGTARISRYSNKTKVQRLPIEPISQASANQRAGRCGRVADGICIRLYSQEDFESRPEFTQPEIQRTSLASVILHMMALRLGEVSDFPFIDPPEERAVRAGAQLLSEIGAIETRSFRGETQTRLTKIGKQLARLPIDPRLGRMLIEAQRNGCASEVLVIVAALSVQDVRERPSEKRPQADQLHARFTASSSDFLAYLTLWRYLHTQRRELSSSAFRRMCRAEFLNYLRYREWVDVVAQLRQLARPLGLSLHSIALPSPALIRQQSEAPSLGGTPISGAVAGACREIGRSSDTPEAGAIHRSLLVGLLSNIGSYSQRTRDYEGARGSHFVIWPGSGLHRRTPSWVMTAELVETSRLFARTVAAIEPGWIEPLAKDLVKRTYSEPFWSARNGAAMCREKVTLYGVTLVADRQILLQSVGTESSRELARDMFIRHALVEGDWRTHHRFLKDNARALEEASEVEERLRRRGLVADSDALAAFYEERIPEHIVSGRHFDSWWKKERHNNPELLNFTSKFLLGDVEAQESDYPTQWVQGDFRLPIEYSFSPGSYADGITVTVPITVLAHLSPVGFDWLVPGMREELVTATIRAFPKRIRRQLVPAPDVAKQIIPLLAAAPGPEAGQTFREAFDEAVFKLRNFWIDDDAWAETSLPEHMKVLFRVRSERGAVLDESTSLEYLQMSLAPQTRSAVEKVVRSAVSYAFDESRAGKGQSLEDLARSLSFPKEGSSSLDGAVSGASMNAGTTEKLGDGPAAHLPLSPESFSSQVLPGLGGEPINGWPCVSDGLIPSSVEAIGPHGMPVRGYPALQVNAKGEVRLGVVTDPATQVREHARAVAALLARSIELPDKRISTRWSGDQGLALAGSPYADTSALIRDLQLASARNLVSRWAQQHEVTPGLIRAQREWEDLRTWAKQRHEDEVYRIAIVVADICAQWAEVARWLKESRSPLLLATLADIRAQMDELVSPGFVSRTPEEYLPEIVRYVKAARIRIQKATTNPSGDDALAWQIQHVVERIEAARAEAARHPYDPGVVATVEQARWMVEELRVSLFAQQLGTRGKVSVKRIEKVLATLPFV